jgi:hypothetical protein
MKQKTWYSIWFIGLAVLLVLYVVCFPHMMTVFHSKAGTSDTIMDVVMYDVVGFGCWATLHTAVESKRGALVWRVLLVVLGLILTGCVVYLNVASFVVA